MCFCTPKKVDDPEEEYSEKASDSSSKYRSLDSTGFSPMINSRPHPPPGPPSRSSGNSSISTTYILNLLLNDSSDNFIIILPQETDNASIISSTSQSSDAYWESYQPYIRPIHPAEVFFW